MSSDLTDGAPVQPVAKLRESLELARELADALERQAARIKRECEQVEESLRGVPDRVAMADGADRAPDADAGAAVDRARLSAMEMATQGHSRAEVEAYLGALAVTNVDEILDAVFPGEPGES